MDDALDAEWKRYRLACERVDLFRWDRSLDLDGDLHRRLGTAEQLVKVRDAAIDASSKLIAAASHHPDIDLDWLAELREHHRALVDARRDDQKLADETYRHLHPPS